MIMFVDDLVKEFYDVVSKNVSSSGVNSSFNLAQEVRSIIVLAHDRVFNFETQCFSSLTH